MAPSPMAVGFSGYRDRAPHVALMGHGPRVAGRGAAPLEGTCGPWVDDEGRRAGLRADPAGMAASTPSAAAVDRAAVAGHPGIMAARRRRRAPRHERDHADGRAKPHDPSVHLKFLWYACLDGGYRYAPGDRKST